MERLQYFDWSAAEWLAAASSILAGHANRGTRSDDLCRELAGLYGEGGIYAINAGRTGIRFALEVFRERRPQRDRVIYPSYICPNLVQTIRRCGMGEMTVDVGADLNLTPAAVARALDDRVLAVIAPHMYACPAKIAEIEQLCREAGVFLIDDAAHMVEIETGSRRRPFGRFGDVGIISFNQSKTLVSGKGAGGILFVNNPELEPALRERVDRLPHSTTAAKSFLDFVWDFMISEHLGSIGYYWQAMVRRLRGDRPAPDYYRPSRMSNLGAAIAYHQFRRFPERRAGRIRVGRAYQREIGNLPGVGFPQYAADTYLSRILLLMPERVNVPALRSELRRSGVQTRPGYPAFVSPGACVPNASMLSPRLVEVPSHATMDDATVRGICRKIAAAMAAQDTTILPTEKGHENAVSP